MVTESAGQGSDTVLSAVSYTLAAGAEIERLGTISAAATTAINLTGNAFAQLITGNAGINLLQGLGGDDTLSGGAGGDLLDGGAGSDWASYAGSTSGVNADLRAPGDGQSALTGDAAGDVYIGIENLLGSDFNDTLRGDDGANQLAGGAGADRFWAQKGNDTLTGGAGEDVFYFQNGYGADRIQDFENDVDTITFSKMGFASVATAMSYASQSGTDVVFNFGGGDTLTVLNTTLLTLQDDILLV